MKWATENASGQLTIHTSKSEAERVAEWGNDLTVKCVRVIELR